MAARTRRLEAHHHLRTIPQHIAMNILTVIHRLAESNSGEKRLRVGDFRVRFTEEHPETLRIHTVRNRKDAYR